MPVRDRMSPQKIAATDRYYAYQREMRDLLDKARELADRGLWDEAAVQCNAALMTLGAMSGVCREMHLYTMLSEER